MHEEIIAQLMGRDIMVLKSGKTDFPEVFYETLYSLSLTDLYNNITSLGLEVRDLV